ncbi:MAG: class I SAM-dependent methyltransferase [Candidatus Aminicenantes bacterium]|nr:class I SAM-dependent methyltransferase [Candidatus Aminicenantes bacterium]
MSSSTNKTFRRDEVRDYERRRYRGLDQRLVDRRERRITQKLLAAALSRAEKSAPRGAARGSPPLVLDVPCGYGRLSVLVLEQGARLVAGDISLHMVERALQNVAGRGPAEQWTAGVVTDLTKGLPFRGGAFDAAIVMRLFHHLHRSEDRRAVLAEAARVARGPIVLSFYRMNRLHVLQRKLRKAMKGKAYEIRMITGRMFRDEVEAAGLRVVRVVPLFRGLHAQHIAVLEAAHMPEKDADPLKGS